MNRRMIVLAVAFFTLPFLTLAVQVPREKQWKQVQEAINKGLPQTAIKHLEPIIAAAIKDKAYPEAIKAVARKIALEGNIQGNKPEEKVIRMKAAIAAAPAEMRPVMDTILANWYWHFFQQNRWRFMRRTTTAEPVGDDILTWDLPRILAEVDKQFTKALSAEKALKSIPIGQYDDLLQKGTVPDSYRPTLYDFLAHNALGFYLMGEQAGAKAQDAFELPADSPIFAPVADFLKWDPQTTDRDSRTVRAIRLFQDLLRFHQNDKDRSAFLDSDLTRLNFGKNKAVGEEKNARYKAALKLLAEANPKHEVGSRARYHWGVTLQQEGDLVQARTVALVGAKALPDSYGGTLCHNLVQTIEAKSSSVTTERVWNDPLPTVNVNYRNLNKVYFRAVPYNFNDRLQATTYRPEHLNKQELQGIVARKPALEWSADLPATQDYQPRTEKLPAPKDLKPGFYFLLASHDPKFGEADNTVSYSAFWVSTLSMVMRVRHGEGSLEGFVLDAKTGMPVANAEVRPWYRTPKNGWAGAQPGQSDGNGYFRFDGGNNRSYLVHAKHKGQELHTAHDYHVGRYNPVHHVHRQTIFFTDRSLYRPGQTVQYRGLCTSVDQGQDNYQTINNQMLTVIFSDPNGKEVARKQHRTNDYGSFSGSFIAPTGKVTGMMTLRTQAEPHGATNVSIEEYKRPKFQVTVDKPKEAPKLLGEVVVQGKATAYTGAAIDGGKVRFRVVRQVRFPDWYHCCYWWRPPMPRDTQEIAHGEAATGVDGSFTVKFTAHPDLTVPAKDEPTFHYTVHADVTDTTGETRSGQTSVNVGYTALKAALTAADWQTTAKPVELTARTTTLDGEAQEAQGTIKVYRLKQPTQVHRASLRGRGHFHFDEMPFPRGGMPFRPGPIVEKDPEPDLSNPNSWELGEVAAEKEFKTGKDGSVKLPVQLGVGVYRATLETKDRFGKKVTALLPVQVLDPAAKKLAIKVPHLVAAPKWSVEPGEKFSMVWGTGYDQARAYVEVEHRRKILKSFWTEPAQTQVALEQAVTEAMRGGFTVRVTYVKENRAYLETRQVQVPWSNKDLSIRWERFQNKLEPGQKVSWTAVVTGPKAQKAVAEMVATLYDASLDAYLPHHWTKKLAGFRQDYSNLHQQFENQIAQLMQFRGNWRTDHRSKDWTYRQFPHDIAMNFWGFEFFDRDGRFAHDGAPMAGFGGGEMAKAAPGMPADGPPAQFGNGGKGGGLKEDQQLGGGIGGAEQPPAPDLSKVSPRKNLNETAFFFPHLISDKDGEVRLQFTVPEALTKWKFMGFTHDRELRSGYLEDSVVTSRDLMVQPHAPRFLREGDLLEFTVKVANQSDKQQAGTVKLTFADARTGKSVDVALSNTDNQKAFDLPAKQSRSFAWKLRVPDNLGLLTYKAVGSTGKISDGEEDFLPVLSKRILVTESLPLPIRGPQTKDFNFKRLLESGKSETLQHKTVTVQMVSNPSWYAIMALPYLMEYPYECSEQVFNRLYANSLARYIATSDPKIRQVFNQWKNTPALDSPLMKNQDLRSVLLEETPWVRQAESESQARRNVGILFDDNRLNQETARLTKQLADMQLPDGAWPWFPGGRGNDYITLYITTGYGRLRHLGVKIDETSALRALSRLDNWIDQTYREIVRRNLKDKNNLSPTIALYLYGRSFFLQDRLIAPNHKEAVDYFRAQAKAHWLKVANRQSQAHIAVALNRFGDRAAAQGIMKSLKERSVTHEELGMFWRDTELSWWWYRAPIESQAMMIEAFEEVANDTKSVEDCKVWLLKQKQTQDWKTTKATADACYALLLRGGGDKLPLLRDALVEVTVGGVAIKPEKVEAGTGFYEKRYVGSDIKPELGKVTVKKTEEGVAWGSVHWQYLEDVSKVTAYEGTPLTLKKSLFRRVYTKKGPVLERVTGALKVGDEIVVRLELRVDRDMEYVHLKAARGSGTEPVNVLSRYRYQDGLGYYESTRDTATHFFIDYLPKGTYVFEYSTRAVHRGEYQTGLAEIQCMYAPEFNSHSQSIALKVE
ncbi:MAG: MG2 domain-containing protein [Gemmataceae bacterium]|nr:MG2 domain-containing protein [Gemmataceae bacterium]